VSVPSLQLVLLAVALLALAGGFAASEASLARVSRSRAGELVAQGRRGAKALARVVDDPAPTLNVSTFLRVAAEAGAAASITVVLLAAVGSWWQGLVAATAVVAAVSFVAVGVGPRTVGRQHADRVAVIAAPVMLALSRVLGPLARLLVLVANAFTPGRGYRDGPFASEAELRELVDLAQERAVIEDDEREMIHSVFELGDTLTRAVMVPRTDVVSIDRTATLRASMSLFLRSGFSRVPVTGEGLDDVVGVLYLKDVARRLHERPDSATTKTVEELMRAAFFVPDSKPVDDLLRQMQADAAHVAIVVDEYGGTAGLVTIEDILEEIVGEIADEYDADEAEDVEDLGSGVYRVRARLHLDELGELFDLDLEDEEVDTVGGLMAKSLGRVPIAGSRAGLGGLLLTAERFEGRRHRLATLLVQRDPDAPEPDRGEA
jgi:CBS domain containing-hemolysin-like protein